MLQSMSVVMTTTWLLTKDLVIKPNKLCNIDSYVRLTLTMF